jgi:hypothetical protein
MAKILILTGAPEHSALDWSTDGLLSEFQESVAWFAGINTDRDNDMDNNTGSLVDDTVDALNTTNNLLPLSAPTASGHPAWRSLSMGRGGFTTSFSQEHAINFNHGPDESVFGPSPEFLDTVSLSFASDDPEGEHSTVLSQLYEHSVAAHHELPSSQLLSQSTGQATSFLSDTTSSLMSSGGSQAGSIKGPLLFRGSDLLTNLKDFPSAAYLLKIQPQTVTCNIIVGIISLSQPRAVKTRWGATNYLVEVLVGDETKAGFAVTYWLPSDTVDESPLAGLRPRDIVLMQNVALNVFTNKVYGSSLRKNLTKVHLLYRTKLDSQDPGGYYSTFDMSSAGSSVHTQLGKTRRVRDWVLAFVGRGNDEKGKAHLRPRWDKPPADDTQLL